ncbi:MAG: hypothetical protein U1F23_12380 [Lysobacterales bacterium]
MRSHLIVADGLELVIAPDRARLTQVQVRQLFRSMQDAYNRIRAGKTPGTTKNGG